MEHTIKTFEDACKALNIDTKNLPDLSVLPEKEQKATLAFIKLRIISSALNEGWVPNWEDRNEWKYYPWFEFVPGSGFRYDVCVNWGTCTYVGSRLCFKSEKLAEYAGEQFIELYNDMMAA